MPGMLTPDGRCKALDAAADGYVRAEDCVAFVLRASLHADNADDETTVIAAAVVRGSALSQDGRSSSLTAPNGPAQQTAIRSALAGGGMAAGDVGAVEMHGTGTALGDPIEVGAIAAVSLRPAPGRRPLALSAVKSRLGHAECGAGALGLLSAVMQLGKGTAHGVTHLREPNAYVVGSLPSTATVHMPRQDGPAPMSSVDGGEHCMGVSSFAFQGTNAHAVLRLAPPELRSHAATASGAALPWRRRRYWFMAAGHPLLCRHAAAGGSSGYVVLQADLAAAAAAALVAQHRLAGQPAAVLPSTTLLELAAGAGSLLTEDGADALPAVAHAAMISRLPLSEPSQASGPLVTVEVEARSGKAAAKLADSSALLISFSFCQAVSSSSSTSSCHNHGTSAALSSLLPCIFEQEPKELAVAEMGLERPRLSGALLPPAACEAVTALIATGDYGETSGLLVGCELFVLTSAQTPVSGGSIRASHLYVYPCGSGGQVLQSTGAPLLRMAGIVLAPAASSSAVGSSTYVVAWNRIEAGEADARCDIRVQPFSACFGLLIICP